MTIGTENSSTPNGINSFSGYMKTKASSGVAITDPRIMDYAATGQYIEGAVTGTLVGIPLELHYKSNDYSFNLSSTVFSSSPRKEEDFDDASFILSLSFSIKVKFTI